MSSSSSSSSNKNKKRGSSAVVQARESINEFLTVNDSGICNWLSYDRRRNGRRIEEGYQLLLSKLRECPELAKEMIGGKPETTTYPLFYVLAAKAPLEDVSNVFAMYPDVIHFTDCFGLLPLHAAIKYNCSFEVISFLLSKNEPAIKVRCSNTAHPFGREPLLALEILLYRTRNLHDDELYDKVKLLVGKHPAKTDTSNHIYLHDRLLKSALLDLEAPAWLWIWLGQQGQLLHKTSPVQKRKFARQEFTAAYASNFKRYLKASGRDKVEFIFVNCVLETAFFSELLTFSGTPEFSLSFSGLFIQGSMETLPDWSRSQVKRIEIQHSNLTTAQLGWLMHGVPSTLATLVLRDAVMDGQDCTEVIKSILARGRADRLVVSEMKLEESQLETFLSTADTTTLYSQMLWKDDAFVVSETIKYLSAMNRCGRAKIAKPDSNTKDLVNSLKLLGKDQVISPEIKFAVQYGLLRQAPGLWASTGAQEGRKRPAGNPLKQKGTKRQKVKSD